MRDCDEWLNLSGGVVSHETFDVVSMVSTRDLQFLSTNCNPKLTSTLKFFSGCHSCSWNRSFVCVIRDDLTKSTRNIARVVWTWTDCNPCTGWRLSWTRGQILVKEERPSILQAVKCFQVHSYKSYRTTRYINLIQVLNKAFDIFLLNLHRMTSEEKHSPYFSRQLTVT